MGTKFQIHLICNNYDNGSRTIAETITIEDIAKFKPIINAINNSNVVWNWYAENFPEIWDGKKFIYDKIKVENEFKNNFGASIDFDIIYNFDKKFVPPHTDGIGGVKIYKIEEININNDIINI